MVIFRIYKKKYQLNLKLRSPASSIPLTTKENIITEKSF